MVDAGATSVDTGADSRVDEALEMGVAPSMIMKVVDHPSASGASKPDKLSHSRKNSSKDSNPTGSRTRKAKLKRLKTFAWSLLGISELIIATLILVQILTFRSFLNTASNRTSEDQVKFLDLGYGIKMNQMGFGFQGLAKSEAFQTLLKTAQNASEYASLKSAVVASLQNEVKTRKIEYATLLDASGTIIASANTDRSGETGWNSDVVSLLLNNHTMGQLKITSTVTLSELRKENPPLWREGTYSYDAVQHMFDTLKPGLVRYTATAVIDSSKTFVGVLVSGDVISGKTKIFETTTDIFGEGFGGVIFKNVSDGTWITATQEMIDSSGIKIFKFSIPTALLEKGLGESVTAIESIDGSQYSITVKPIPKMLVNNIANGQNSNAVLVRGYPHTKVTEIFYEVIVVTLALFAGSILLDFIGTVLAFRFFIDPLEKLLVYVHFQAFKHYDPILNRIRLNERFFARVSVIALFSAGLFVGIVFHNSSSLNQAFAEQSATKAQVLAMDVTFEVKMNQMSFGYNGLSTDVGMKALLFDMFTLSDPTNSTHFLSTKSLLYAEIPKRKIEFSTLVDKSKKIIVHSFSDSRIGAIFNPNGIVDEVLKNNRRILVTTTMSKQDFLLEQAIPYVDSNLNPALDDSKLMPRNSDNTIVVRFACTPIFATNNTAALSPDGVLIAGDIINGKAALNELVLSTFGDGLSAYYFYNSNSTKYELVSGVYKDPSGSYDYNPTDLGIDDLLNQAMEAEVPVYKEKVKYKGESLEVAVSKVKSSMFVDVAGNQLPLTNYKPPVFHVRAVSGSRWADLRKTQLAVQIVTVLFQLVSLVGISYFLYLPIRTFAAHISKDFKTDVPKLSLAAPIEPERIRWWQRFTSCCVDSVLGSPIGRESSRKPSRV